MKTYRIKDWSTHFENNRTRELKHLAWVPFPNKHDGDGYTDLLDHKNGAAHYGAWCALVQVASKCDVRGTLLRDTAVPYCEISLCRVTRIPEAIWKEALPRLVSIGWLEVYDNPALGCDNPALGCGLPEQNRTEQKEQKEAAPVLVKRPYGELKTVMLTDDEYRKLQADHPADKLKLAIEILDGYIASKKPKYASHYAVLKKGSWVWDRVREKSPARQVNI